MGKIKKILLILLLISSFVKAEGLDFDIGGMVDEGLEAITSEIDVDISPITDTITDFADGVGEYLDIEGLEEVDNVVRPMDDIEKTTQWDLFFDQFVMSMNVYWCEYGYFEIPGLESRMVEPIGYFETTQKQYYFPFADIDLSDDFDMSTENLAVTADPETGEIGALDFFKFGSTRKSVEEDSTEGGRDDIVWSHFIKFPIFGMIFGAESFSWACFTGGSIDVYFISELFPPYTNDVMYENIGGTFQMVLMYGPTSILTSIIDCAGAITVDTLNGFTSIGVTEHEMGDFMDGMSSYTVSSGDYISTAEYWLNSLRNTMYWDVGCLGFSPMGGYVPAQDPGSDNELVAHGVIHLLHELSTLKKQTEFSFGIVPQWPTWCYAVPHAMIIESQYLLQRAGVPSIGHAHAFGMTPLLSTHLANNMVAQDDWVNLIWRYRDYAAFAYICPM